MAALIVQRFLASDEYESILDYACNFEHAFRKSGVIGDPSWRESRLTHEFAPWDREIRERVGAMCFAVMDALAIPRQEIVDIEAQMTAHNDAQFFKRHADVGHPSTNPRVISYVYYFWREPKPFLGGEIEIEGTIYTPPANSIIFFPSSAMHEVMPVRCASKCWQDSRFTVNGWCRNKLIGVDG